MTLHQIFVDIKRRVDTKTLNSCLGICSVVTDYFPVGESSFWDELYDLFEQWPEYSGNDSYPVPHPTLHCADAFCSSTDAKMWYEGEYAAARIRLLDFLIEATK